MAITGRKTQSYLMQDSGLLPYLPIIAKRTARVRELRREVRGVQQRLLPVCDWHRHYGFQGTADGWSFREWLPNATEVYLVGEFSEWRLNSVYGLHALDNGDWEGHWPVQQFREGQQYRLLVRWKDGSGYRLPSSTMQVVRNSTELSRDDVVFNAVVPKRQERYPWKHGSPKPCRPVIYEAHVGMAQDKQGVGTFREFTKEVLPRIARAGYNTVQLMGLMQHPYYGSFGYQVSNFFAVHDLLGTPDDLRELVDTAHGMGLRVLMDLVHSHASANTVEGLSEMDGTRWQYFHDGTRGEHPGWGTRCFDYGKVQVLRFLLSNCRYWLEEFRMDGFRFDGVTSMLYLDHGLGRGQWSYADYFSPNVDWDAFAYLTMANEVVKRTNPDAITIAEEVSGFPGLAAPVEDSGAGFDYRLAMGVTDTWFKLTDIRDEDWCLGSLWHELTAHRSEEKCISYVECHDQALVGGQTFIFKLIGKEMYGGMSWMDGNVVVDRGMALHKLARLVTFATGADGYLNFIGNEFGHPDWVDFPGAHNGWSYQYACRQWHLADDTNLKYRGLGEFDRAMLALGEDEPQLFGTPPRLLLCDDSRKLLAFLRGAFMFVFNFHPTESYENLEVLSFPGTYDLVLDTDREAFCGHGRIAPGQRFFTQPHVHGKSLDHYIQVYLPARSAMVLRRDDK